MLRYPKLQQWCIDMMIARFTSLIRFALLFIVFLSSNAFADAWTQPAGKGIVVSSLSYYHTDSFYDRDDERVDVPDFSKTEWRGYGEYGLTDAWTLGVGDALMALSQDDVAGVSSDNMGESGLQLFARRLLWQSQGYVLSLQPSITLPAHHRDSDVTAPLGAAEEWQGGVELQSGYGFDAYALHHYVSLGLGWRGRSSAAHDMLTAKIAAGISLDPRWQFRPEISYTRSTDIETAGVHAVAGLDDYALTKVQLQMAYAWAEDVSLTAGGFWHVWAENTGGNGGALVSIEKRF